MCAGRVGRRDVRRVELLHLRPHQDHRTRHLLTGSLVHHHHEQREARRFTTTTSNGKLVGFGTSTAVSDTDWDRQIHLDPAGRVVFGVYPGTVETVASPAGTNYADGQCHQVVATLSSAGMALHLDGALVAANHSVTSAQGDAGYWKIGCGRLQGWAAGNGAGYNVPDYHTGSLSYVAIYTTALNAAQVPQHFDGGRA
ncbi:MAG: hypothetical protein M0Z51_08105 [Propionibacterium sp.]|nr:hypothetical protein [Propionibacterium sp.]